MNRWVPVAAVCVLAAGGLAWWLWPTGPAPEPVATAAVPAPVRAAPAPRTVRLVRPQPVQPPKPASPAQPVVAIEPHRTSRRTLGDLDDVEKAERLAFWEDQALHQLLDDCLGGMDHWDPTAVRPGTGMQISTVVDAQGLNEIGLSLHGDVAESADELEACLQDSAWDLDWPPFDDGELLEQTTWLLGHSDGMAPLGPPPIPDPLPTLYLVDGEYLTEDEFQQRQAEAER